MSTKASARRRQRHMSVPDAMQTLFDRLQTEKPVETPMAPDGDEIEKPLDRPTSSWAAALRGARNRCPRCGKNGLFRRFLKPHTCCPHCAQDWRPQRADDFPAYASIFLTGHILAPLIIWMVQHLELSPGALAAIIMPLAIALLIALLQPAKGAIIAIQWWFGMHGFERESPQA